MTFHDAKSRVGVDVRSRSAGCVQTILRAAAAAACAGLLATMPLVHADTGTTKPSTKSVVSDLLAPKPATQTGQSATQLADGSWLLLGGGSGANVSSKAILQAASNAQASILAATMSVARSGHAATLLPNGQVLVLGGVGADGAVLDSAERFDPATASFTALGSVGLLARTGHTATVLVDGRVLIAGGVDGKGFAVRDVEVYDPVSRAIERLSAPLDAARLRHVAALLPNSNVLLWGGTSPQGQALDNGDLFDATAQRFTSVSAEAARNVAGALSSAGAPSVLESLPAASATQVPVAQRLVLRFNKRMSVASLNAKSVTLVGPSGAVKIDPVAVEGGVLLFVTPQQELLPDSSFTLFVQGTTDEYGQTMPLVAIGFKTAALGSGSTGKGAGTATASVVAAAAATSSQAQTPAAAASAAVVAANSEDDLWIPSEKNFHGEWKSGRRQLAERSKPNDALVRWTLHGDPKLLKATPLQVASGKLPQAPKGPAGVTAVAGQVLKLNGRPLKGVTVSIGNHQVRTDVNGEFLLQGAPDGHQVLVIDGATADHAKRHYGRYEYGMDVTAGQTNVLPFVSWMTALDTADTINVPSPTTAPVVLTNPQIPGLELRIPSGTVIRDAQGKIVTQLSMTAIPVDQPPFPLPNFPVPVYFTVQPGGAHLLGIDAKSAKGAQIVYPNFTHAPAGTRMDFWDYDATARGWFKYGQGSVSADATRVVPDPGVVIYELSGAMISVPANAPTAGATCSCKGKAADPVDLFTGLYLHNRTDLSISDVIPISVSRSYRPADQASRAFGIGTNLSYDLFLVGTTFPYTYQYLILPDGEHVYFPRISSGTSYTDAVYQAQSSPESPFNNAVLRWDASVAGSAWSITLKDGTVYYFPDSYNSTSARSAAAILVRDRFGNTVTLTRDGNHNLTQITSPNGRHLFLTYDSSNRVTQASDDIGRVVQYAYDSSGRLQTITDPLLHTEQLGYQIQTVDPAKSIGGVSTTTNLTTVVDERGNPITTNTYDANGRIATQTYADGTHYTFSYTIQSVTPPPTVIVAGGGGTTPGSVSVVTQVDFTNERGSTTRQQFDANGFTTSITEALGLPEQQTTTYNRDPNTSLVNSEVDALGRTTAYQYDALGNVTQVTRLYGTPNAVSASMTYDPTYNQVTSVTDPNGNKTNWAYDAFGNLVQSTDALGHSVKVVHDSQGRPTTVQDALSHLSSLGYSGADLSTATDALGRTTQFFADSIGRVRSITDPLNNPTYITYDALDRTQSTTDAKGGVVGKTYDPNGNVLTQVDQNLNSTSFSYDGRNRVTGSQDPLSQSDSVTYEPGGEASKTTDRKGQVTAVPTFDGLGRVIQVGYGATVAAPTTFKSTVTNTWDAGNRLTQVVDSTSGTITRVYDDLDRLTSETTPQGSVSYTYDAGGRRSAMTVQGQPKVSYAWDAANRLTQIQQAAGAINGNTVQTISFVYDNANRRVQTTLANGIVAAYAYDDANELTGITYTSSTGTLIGNLTYTYDQAGRRNSLGGSLANVLPGTPVSSVSVDANNRLTNWNGQALTYDANGNLVSDGVNTYTWDERDQLVGISGAITASFTYDTFGRRTSKTIAGVQTNFVYDGINAVQQTTGSNVVSLLDGLGIDERYAELSGSQQAHVLVDALGSTIALTDASQTVQGSYAYDAYGNVSYSGTLNTNAQYTGRENDGTGLYYYRARYYSPKFGRFISEDPAGWASGQTNNYAYVGGSPLSRTDFSGLADSLHDSIAVAVARGDIQALNDLLLTGLEPVEEAAVQQGIRDAAANAARQAATVQEAGANAIARGEGVVNEAKTAAQEAQSACRAVAKGARKYVKNIEEHLQKIKDFVANPTVRPGMEGQSLETIAEQQINRIEGLLGEIEGFKNNIIKSLPGK